MHMQFKRHDRHASDHVRGRSLCRADASGNGRAFAVHRDKTNVHDIVSRLGLPRLWRAFQKVTIWTVGPRNRT